MRILHLNTLDKWGASRSTVRLHKGLLKSGVDSTLIFAPPVSTALPSRIYRRFLGKLVSLRERFGLTPVSALEFRHYGATRPEGLEAFSDDRAKYGRLNLNKLPPCDLINLHWVAGFFDYQDFFRVVSRRTPVVWRLADMNAFTGGCHYNSGCEGYNSGCGACPQLGSTDTNDLSHQVWKRKQQALSAVAPGRLHIVAQSTWMARKVEQSALFGRFPVTVIPNGLDVTVFLPRDRALSRNVFGIPQNAHVVLFVADSVENRRKGFDLLIKALSTFVGLPDVFLVSIGINAPKIAASLQHKHIGFVGDDEHLSMLYSAADVFVIPSREDNLPNTVIESMACGTPVVGFDVGGIPDMVRPMFTGLLAKPEDDRDLGKAIYRLLTDDALRTGMSANCRSVAVNEYAQEVQAAHFVEFYEAVIRNQNGKI